MKKNFNKGLEVRVFNVKLSLIHQILNESDAFKSCPLVDTSLLHQRVVDDNGFETRKDLKSLRDRDGSVGLKALHLSFDDD